MKVIDEINEAYDKHSKSLEAHNQSLAGKIEEEKLVTDLLSEKHKTNLCTMFCPVFKEHSEALVGYQFGKCMDK